jgi:ABC-type bacteriocin/lantibiotic exporter with double-glycine peptidase domain
MVLAHHGSIRTEAELRTLLDTGPTGTRAGNVMRVSSDQFEVHLRPSNVLELRQLLSANEPAIVFLKTGALEYWQRDIFHTAVVVGIDSTTIVLHDSYFPTGPQTTSLESFEKAWARTGQFAAFILPRKPSDGK